MVYLSYEQARNIRGVLVPCFFVMFSPLTVKMILPGLVKNQKFIIKFVFQMFC